MEIHRKIKTCLITGKPAENYDNSTGIIHGYSYRININGNPRLIKLTAEFDELASREELQEFGLDFLKLIEENNFWTFFEVGRSLKAIREKYFQMKNSSL